MKIKTSELTGAALDWAVAKAEGDNMNGYIGFYNGEQVDILAATKYEAVIKAMAHFRAPRSRQHMVHVELAERSGKQVTHVAVD